MLPEFARHQWFIRRNTDTLCCGLLEIEGIQRNPKNPMLNLLGICATFSNSYRSYAGKPAIFRELQMTSLSFAHVVFTQAGSRSNYGTQLAKLIQKLNLGTVVTTPRLKNPNSNRMVTAFIWTPDKPNLINWWNDQVEPQEVVVK